MNSRFAIGAVFALLMLVGCGGPAADMGFVTGVVTLDGEPVGNATIAFLPTAGRSSTGFTNASGEYELAQTRDRMGAAIGTHKVTVVQDALDVEEGVKRVKIPRIYGDKKRTELTKTVEGGSNEINIELKSK